MSFIAPFVSISLMSSTGRKLKDITGRTEKKAHILLGIQVPGKWVRSALLSESKKQRSVPQPSPFLLREMETRGRFKPEVSGL